MLTDALWTVLAPLIEACRPAAKVPPRHLRRTAGAMLWRHDNAAKWRAAPNELGPWWKAAQTFIRWSRLGVWDQVPTLAQEHGVQLAMTLLDGVKACGITDAMGRAVAFGLAPGQAHELPHAVALLGQPPDVPGWVAAGRGCSSHAFRERIWNLGARPAIAPKQNEARLACPAWIYTHRNQVERLWARLEEWRAVATRYEETANSFIGVLRLAAAIDWIKC